LDSVTNEDVAKPDLTKYKDTRRIKMEFLVILIIFIIGGIISTRKFVNFNVISDCILAIICIGMIIALVYSTSKLIPIINDILINLMIIAVLVGFLIAIILLSKSIILGAIRIMDYYIHRKEVFKNGNVKIGTLINIISEYNTISTTRYYLIVDFNEKTIKSLYFLDNSYNIGQNIDVIVYKNHSYVLLKV